MAEQIIDGQGNGYPMKVNSDGSLDCNISNIDSFVGDTNNNGIITGNGILTVLFSTSTVQAVGSTDVSNFKGVSVQINTQGSSSTVTFQGSNDNTNWVSIALTISTSVTTAPVVSTTAVSSYYGPLHFKYFRLNVTGITGGTTDGVIVFHSTYSQTNAITSTAVTLGASATNVAKAEDSASASANVGIPPMVVRQDTLVSNAGVSANGDYAFMFCDNMGRVYTNSQVSMQISNGTLKIPRLDNSTESIQTIEYEHHEIHAGTHFYICGYNSELSNNEELNYVVTTPNTTKWAHMTFDFASTLGASLQVFEGTGSVVSGTTATIYNNNRNSATTSTLNVIQNPTSVFSGTQISGYLAGANRVSGFNSRDREMVLKQNTKYLFKFISLANSNSLSYCGEWYEHTDNN